MYAKCHCSSKITLSIGACRKTSENSKCYFDKNIFFAWFLTIDWQFWIKYICNIRHGKKNPTVMLFVFKKPLVKCNCMCENSAVGFSF